MQRRTLPHSGDGSAVSRVLDRSIAMVAGGVAFAVYLLAMPRTVVGEDAGELAAAAYTLGIPHPPGYPLWTLIAHGFVHVIPIGEIAWRTHLVSAFFGALTVYLIAEIVLLLTRHRTAAFVAALVLAFSREFWEQSIIAEVYTLNAFLIALTVLLLLRWRDSYTLRHLYPAALVAGLAAAHYTLSVFLIPVYALWVFAHDLRPRRFRRYLVLFLLTLPGWLIYFYLPLRSTANPAVDWGSPDSPARFLDVVSRSQYGHLITGDARTWSLFGEQLLTFGRLVLFEFSPWVAVLIPVGAVILWRRSRSITALLLGVFLTVALAGILVTNFPIEHHWIWLNTPYWIPAYLTAAVFIGVSFHAWRQWSARGTWMSALVAALLVLSPLAFNLPHNNRRHDTFARDYARNILATLPPEAVYFGGGDHTLFPLLYMQVVEGERPDVLLANRYGYAANELYVMAGEPPPPHRPPEPEENRLLALILKTTDRPVLSASPRAIPGYWRVDDGLLYRYLRLSEQASATDPWETYSWPSLRPENVRGEWSNELMLLDVYAARARHHFDGKHPDLARMALAIAATLAHEDKYALNELGRIAAVNHDDADACAFFERAIATDPEFVPALGNLARCRIEDGDADRALELLARALEVSPDDPTLRRLKQKALASQDR